MADSIEQLSFELTANALSEQERALSGLRTCAGTVLGAASIAGSFIAATASRHPHGTWGILAVIAFALCSGSAIWVLLPHRFVFAFGGEVLLEAEAHAGIRDLASAYRAADIWIEPRLHANDMRLAGLSSWLAVSCMQLTVEIILSAVSLAG